MENEKAPYFTVNTSDTLDKLVLVNVNWYMTWLLTPAEAVVRNGFCESCKLAFLDKMMTHFSIFLENYKKSRQAENIRIFEKSIKSDKNSQKLKKKSKRYSKMRPKIFMVRITTGKTMKFKSMKNSRKQVMTSCFFTAQKQSSRMQKCHFLLDCKTLSISLPNF